MPVKDLRGCPLPDGHPFKGTRIIFGQKRPDSLTPPSEPQASPPALSNAPPAETEADGQKAGALRLAKYKHQNAQLRKQSAKKKA